MPITTIIIELIVKVLGSVQLLVSNPKYVFLLNVLFLFKNIMILMINIIFKKISLIMSAIDPNIPKRQPIDVNFRK